MTRNLRTWRVYPFLPRVYKKPPWQAGGADIGQATLQPESGGLLASIADDPLLQEQAMLIYDALYAWCKTARDEPQSWPQQASAQ